MRNRYFEQADLVSIRRLIRQNPRMGRTRLSEQICEQLNWFQPNGRTKDRACRVALLRLEELGFLALPPRLVENGGKPPATRTPTSTSEPDRPISQMPSRIDLEKVCSSRQSRLWNWLIAEHHYLGVPTPVGKTLRYLIFGDSVLLGAIGFSECAWNVASRNAALSAVGLAPSDCHNFVVSNNRFLIHPLVKIPNLASSVLSRTTAQLRKDWPLQYRQTPLIIETFVDPSKYSGTCYFAANWILVGTTKGFSKKGGSHQRRNEPKMLLLRGLTSSLHRKLERAFPPGKRDRWTEAA
jgi:hypothetical protein